MNVEEQLRLFRDASTAPGASRQNLDAESSFLERARLLAAKSGLAPETVKDAASAMARVELREQGVDLDGLSDPLGNSRRFNDTRLEALEAGDLVTAVAGEVSKCYNPGDGTYTDSLNPEDVYRELRRVHDESALRGLGALADARLEGAPAMDASPGLPAFTGELAVESARRRDAGREVDGRIRQGDFEGALEGLCDAGLDMYRGLGNVSFEDDSEAANAGLDLMQRSAALPGIPLKRLRDVYASYVSIPEGVRDKVDFTRYAGIHPKGGAEWDPWRHTFFLEYARETSPERFDFEGACALDKDGLRVLARVSKEYNGLPKPFRDRVGFDEYSTLSDDGRVMVRGFADVGRPEQLSLDFIRGLESAERTPLAAVSPDERESVLGEMREAREASERGDRVPALQLGWRLRSQYELSPQILINDAPRIFEHFERHAGYSERQVEAMDVHARVREAREAAAVVQRELSGLRFAEASGEERTALDTGGFLLRNSEGETRPDRGRLEAADLTAVSRETGVSVGRLNELIARERSKEFFAHAYVEDGKPVLNPFGMESYTYHTLDDLEEKYTRNMESIRSATEGVDDPQRLREVVQKLDEQGIRVTAQAPHESGLPELEQLRSRIRREIGWHEDQLDIIEASRRIRSGVDPGIVSGEGMIFSYLPRENFRSDSPLSRTGVIGSVTGSIALLHEYRHLDDFMWYGGQRGDFDHYITEVNSYLVNVLTGDRKDWEDVKETLVGPAYMGKHQENPEYPRARELMERSVDVVKNLQDSGVSNSAVTSVLLHATSFQDILRWEPLFEAPETAREVREGKLTVDEFGVMQRTAREEFQRLVASGERTV